MQQDKLSPSDNPGKVMTTFKFMADTISVAPKGETKITTPGFAKATWNFRLMPQTEKKTLLETETRIFCIDEKTKKNFSGYWFVIRPFSGIIRKGILRLIKKKAERN